MPRLEMKNAHERFGKLAYQRRTEKTATNIRVFLDAFVGEERGRAHFVSTDKFNEEGEADGKTIIHKRERFSHELTLAYESGHIPELKETKQNKSCRKVS